MEAEVRPSSPPGAAASIPPLESIYQGLSTYPFHSDPDFQQGLLSIIQSPDDTEDPNAKEETIFQAQCFYFSRKYNIPPIDLTTYKSWLLSSKSQSYTPPTLSNNTPAPSTTATSTTTSPPVSQSHPQPRTPLTAKPEEEQPPYPASFEHIVDLITRNQPIPGIEDIPDTVLEVGASAPNKTPRRKKPWETAESEATVDEGTKDEGVVSILQPSSQAAAVADSLSNAIKADQSEENVAA